MLLSDRTLNTTFNALGIGKSLSQVFGHTLPYISTNSKILYPLNKSVGANHNGFNQTFNHVMCVTPLRYDFDSNSPEAIAIAKMLEKDSSVPVSRGDRFIALTVMYLFNQLNNNSREVFTSNPYTGGQSSSIDELKRCAGLYDVRDLTRFKYTMDVHEYISKYGIRFNCMLSLVSD